MQPPAVHQQRRERLLTPNIQLRLSLLQQRTLSTIPILQRPVKTTTWTKEKLHGLVMTAQVLYERAISLHTNKNDFFIPARKTH
jgi:hypothetical protein